MFPFHSHVTKFQFILCSTQCLYTPLQSSSITFYTVNLHMCWDAKRVYLQFRYTYYHVKVRVFVCVLSCVYDSMCIVLCITMLMFFFRPCMQHSRGVLRLPSNNNGGWDPEWTWDGSQLFCSDHGWPVHCNRSHHRWVSYIIHVHRRHVPVIIVFNTWNSANVNNSKYSNV